MGAAVSVFVFQLRKNRDLISVGAYQQGTDSAIDHAILMHPHLMRFLTQDMYNAVNSEDSLSQLQALLEGNAAPPVRAEVSNAEPA